MKDFLSAGGVDFNTFKDHVIFEKDEVLKDDGKPYTVFTPYSKKWLSKLESRSMVTRDETGAPEKQSFYLTSYPTEKYVDRLLKISPLKLPALEEIGFKPAGMSFPPAQDH